MDIIRQVAGRSPLFFLALLFMAGPAWCDPAPAPATNAPPVAAAENTKTFTNSLGMTFRAVPGTNVLFCLWPTRVKDYQVFVSAKGRNWPKPDFAQGPTHPAVCVTWEDASAFAAWLTHREQAA